MLSEDVEQVAPEIFRIELPLPTPALKSMNAYVVRDKERSLIIDCGLNRKDCLAALEDGLKRIGVTFAQSDFFLTHCHGDHMGLVPRVATERSKIYLHALEYEFLQVMVNLDPVIIYMIGHGFPQDRIQPAIARFPTSRADIESRARLKCDHLGDGDRLWVGSIELIVQHTPGHSPGHSCLYDPAHKLLFSGDHILGDISPGIQCISDLANTVAAYLGSLKKIRQLDLELILPGHRSLIRQPYDRIDQLLTHHQQRCEEILSLIQGQSLNAYELASRMSWDIPCADWDAVPDEQKWHATGEAIAHLRYLEEQRRVVRLSGENPVKFTVAN
jgi:glyoxylase-like metal-dependent hydrolase (beta-lactamase superfamily II)